MSDQPHMPSKTLEAIQRWLEDGTHPDMLGSFVRAVLCNDLRAAVSYADDENLAAIRSTVGWVYWNVPSGTYGTFEKLVAYHKHRSQKGAA